MALRTEELKLREETRIEILETLKIFAKKMGESPGNWKGESLMALASAYKTVCEVTDSDFAGGSGTF